MYWYIAAYSLIMQANAGTDGTDTFCNDCANDLRDYYNACTDGVGVSTVDTSKSYICITIINNTLVNTTILSLIVQKWC